MKTLTVLMVGALGMGPVAARADFTYQETTQITGGTVVSMMKFAGTFSRQARQAGDPVVTTVTVKGNRMMRVGRDHSEIIDLDAGTVTEIDNLRHEYTTMTFEQMRQRIEAAEAKAKAQQSKQPQQAPEPANQAQTVDMKFNVKVRNTGATREVAGLDAKESILTMTMDATDQKSQQTGSLAITNDMYLAPDIPGYDEVREFYKKYAVRMGVVVGGAMSPQMMGMMAQPAAGKGMADMAQEMAKLKGIPVLQIMRMGTTANGTPLPAASEAPLPSGPPPPSAGDLMKQSIANSIPFGGFSRKKKADPPPADDASTGTTAVAVLMESNTQLGSFSRETVESTVFRPPADYKRIEPKPLD